MRSDISARSTDSWRVLTAEMKTDSERLAMLLLVGTIPAAVLGVFLESRIKTLFASPYVAAGFLIVNGLLMLGFELLRRRKEKRASRIEQESQFADAERISFRAAALVGACQALALLPGISRSGVTIGGGLLAGLRHQEAARLSFLLATPIIAAAGLIEVPLLFSPNMPLGVYLAGAVLALGAAYLSARFLLRYFRSGRLDPYGWYCAAAGLASLILLTFNS